MDSKYIIIVELLLDFLSVNDFVKLSKALNLPEYQIISLLNRKISSTIMIQLILLYEEIIEKESLYISKHKRDILKKRLNNRFDCDSIEKIFVFLDYYFIDKYTLKSVFSTYDHKLYKYENNKLNEITFSELILIIKKQSLFQRTHIDYYENKLNRYELNFIGFLEYYKLDERFKYPLILGEEKKNKIIIDPINFTNDNFNRIIYNERFICGPEDDYDNFNRIKYQRSNKTIVKWNEYYGLKKIYEENKITELKLRKSIEELLIEMTDEDILDILKTQGHYFIEH